MFYQKFYQSVIVALLLLGNIGFFGVIAWAVDNAKDALPGDLLYSTKLGMEDLQLALAFDDASKAQFYVNAATRRNSEIKILIGAQQYQAIPSLVAELQQDLDRGAAVLSRMGKQNPARAKLIAKQVEAPLQDLSSSLIALESDAPEPIKGVIEQASQSVATSETNVRGILQPANAQSGPADGKNDAKTVTPVKTPAPTRLPANQPKSESPKSQPQVQPTPKPPKPTVAAPTPQQSQGPPDKSNPNGKPPGRPPK